MSGPTKEVARARVSVKSALAEHLARLADSTASGQHLPRVLVGVSGGADSLALAASVIWVASKMGIETYCAIIDHGLSPDSESVSERAAIQCERLGASHTLIRKVQVDLSDGGLENAARNARHAALESLREETRSLALFLGHTLDDQAEQVFLGLARGAGARSLAGIPRTRGWIIRPFLGTGRDEATGLWRADTEAICEALDIDYWIDPMNADPAYARVQARTHVLPLLKETFGPHIALNLVRSADLLRDDADYLDQEASELFEGCRRPPRHDSEDLLCLDAYALAVYPRALRTRIVKRAIDEAANLQGERSSKGILRRHILQVDALITAFRGQGPILLPGKIESGRDAGLLFFRPGLPERTSHS